MRWTSYAMLGAMAASLALAGCVAPRGAGGNPYPPPPALITEAVPQPPISQQPLVWQPGHWDWTGAGYAWSNGLWVPSAGHPSNWLDGFWTNANGPWTWVPAHWV